MRPSHGDRLNLVLRKKQKRAIGIVGTMATTTINNGAKPFDKLRAGPCNFRTNFMIT